MDEQISKLGEEYMIRKTFLWGGNSLGSFFLAPNKAPGPDSFSLTFFQECLEIVKWDDFDLLPEFHSNEKIPMGLNSTFITLIPKKVVANRIQDFDRISLISARTR